MSVALRGLTKTYLEGRGRARRPVIALDGVDLSAAAEEFLVVVGPSGSGKSTLLRCIAGLERADRGTVEVGGREVTAKPPGERDVAMVFQDHALYPHLSVRDNIAFALRARKDARADVAARVTDVARTLRLERVLDRNPGELSGGERQRVALGRAIVRKPSAFLMDEPLSDLDAELRAHTRAEIRSLQRRLSTTTIYVTHDQVEAMTLGDRVAILRAGRVQQLGSPMELYDRPASAFVARFLGTPPMNVVPAGVVGMNGAPFVGLRPESIVLTAVTHGRVRGRVELVEHLGAASIVHVNVAEHRILVRAEPSDEHRPGDDVGLTFDAAAVHLFESEDGPAVGRS